MHSDSRGWAAWVTLEWLIKFSSIMVVLYFNCFLCSPLQALVPQGFSDIKEFKCLDCFRSLSFLHYEAEVLKIAV